MDKKKHFPLKVVRRCAVRTAHWCAVGGAEMSHLTVFAAAGGPSEQGMGRRQQLRVLRSDSVH